MQLFTGEFVWQQTDLQIAGRGIDFEWVMNYRSRPLEGRPAWEHGYNIRAEKTPEGIHVFEGGARTLYTVKDGTYRADGVFADARLQREVFRVRFSGGGVWTFRPLNDASAAGCIARIEDQNGNSLNFEYNISGSLEKIVDTLGRSVHVGYDRNGNLATVADFTGREIQYRCSKAGVLESVRYPAVTGTVTGNNFPRGATVAFGYAADGMLNSISDRSGKPAVAVEYGSVKGQGSRVSTLRRGTDNPTHVQYAQEGDALLAIVNDPAGNVTDYLFDGRGSCVRTRTYTGRANAGKPTNATANGPGKPLRANEPAFYETRYSYSTPDGLIKRTERPDGSIVQHEYEFDRNPNAAPIERGNLRTVRTNPGKAGGDQKELVRTFEYLAGFGCTCGQAFVTRETDPRGAVTVQEYDKRGNVIALTDRGGSTSTFKRNSFGDLTERIFTNAKGAVTRRDKLEYSAKHGQLVSETLDATSLKLTTAYSYDDLGRLTVLRDPAGHDHGHAWNSWDRMVRRTLPDGTTEDVLFDLNEKKVGRIITEGGIKIRESFEYDATGRVIAVSKDADAKRQVVRRFDYDGVGNRISSHRGEAQTALLEYDTRGLLLRRNRGKAGSGAIEVCFEVDGLGRVTAVSRGTGAEQSTVRSTYDGYGRLISVSFPDGSTMRYTCDANGNAVRQVRTGPDQEEPFETVTQTFDAMDRMTKRVTRLAGSTSPVTETWEYDLRGRLVNSSGADGTRSMRYDELDRCVWADVNGVVTEFTYDPNSNLLTEDTNAQSGAKRLRTKYTLDERGRTVRVDGPGEWFWEGKLGHRDLPVSTKTPGGTLLMNHDALGRMTQATWDSSAKNAKIQLTWDDASRIVGMTDPNGNTTKYDFDHSNRPITTTAPDGGAVVRTFDSRGNCVMWKDANGNVVRNTYDLMDRLVRRVIKPGKGVAADSTTETYSYDALGRLISATNDSHTIERTFDADGMSVVEKQDGRSLLTSFDKQRRRTSVTYPSGYRLDLTYKGSMLRVSDKKGVAVELEDGQTRYPRVGLKSATTSTDIGLPDQLSVSIANKVALEQRYHWDAAGNVRQVERNDGRGLWARTLDVDASGRLVKSSINGNQAIQYEIDEAGNRKSVQGVGKAERYTLQGTDRAMNRYTVTPEGRRSYDANGNLLTVTDSSGEKRMRYDYRNRMVEHRAKDGTVTRYTYDCMDRRLTKTTGKGSARTEVTYVYDGNELAEVITSGAIQSLLRTDRTMHGIAGPKGQTWFVCDALGSPIAELDDKGNVQRSFEYDDFGQVRAFDKAGVPITSKADLPPISFAAYTFDAESGFLHTRTRYLEPSVGRFISPDPGGIWFDPRSRGNAYAYAANNPATFTDPTGLSVDRSYSCKGPWPGPRTIWVEYQGCSKNRRDKLWTPVCRAFRSSGQAKRGVIARWVTDLSGQNQPHRISKAALAYWFAGPDGGMSLESKSIVGVYLDEIYQAIRGDDFDIDCESGGICSEARAYVNHGGSDVNLCPSFWSSIENNTLAYVLIHELSHAYPGTDDYCYYSYPSNQPWNSIYETPTLRENADSYGCFVLNNYL